MTKPLRYTVTIAASPQQVRDTLTRNRSRFSALVTLRHPGRYSLLPT
ncbi:hypothetical protein OH809_24460 [Streptomyces sp. NBC_00873]|nr:hypothetical protein OH809_24460 [Streptomyces sp. NBC_00873]WTA44423.1 hypothetical protein OH821_18835 [Streptomyces sp. NBC_00842]